LHLGSLDAFARLHHTAEIVIVSHSSHDSSAAARGEQREKRPGRLAARVAGFAAFASLALHAASLQAQSVSARAGIDSADRADSAALGVDTILSLEEALDRARHVSPDVARQNGAVRSARSGEHVALGSYLPTLSLESGAARAGAAVAAAPITPTYAGNAYSAGLIASINVYTGGRLGAERKQARAEREAAEANLVATNYDLRFTVDTTFLGVLRAEALARVAQARLIRAKGAERDAASRLAAGTTTRSDDLRAALEVMSAEQALLEARSAHVSASVALGRLTGLGGRVGAREDDSSVVRPLSVPEDSVLAEIERTSPDVKAAEATAAATSAGVSSAKSHYQPYISAAGGYSYLRQQPELLNDGGTWVARIGLSYPLFDGFVRGDEVTRARADEETARVSNLDTHRFVRASAIRLLTNLAVERRRMTLSEQAVALAREDLRVQDARYREGATTQLERLTSELALVNAEQDAVTARFDYAVARAELEALAGRTL
jgi:outer membrane protein